MGSGPTCLSNFFFGVFFLQMAVSHHHVNCSKISEIHLTVNLIFLTNYYGIVSENVVVHVTPRPKFHFSVL